MQRTMMRGLEYASCGRRGFAAQITARVITIACLLGSGCSGPERPSAVDIVDRDKVFSYSGRSDPLMLVVEIAENGKLRLNRIETGTIGDPAQLLEKLEIVFEDRKRAGIHEKEVLIDPLGEISWHEIEKLVDSIGRTRASPVRIIGHSP